MSGAGPAVSVEPGTWTLSMPELDHHPSAVHICLRLPGKPSPLLNMGGVRTSVGDPSALEDILGLEDKNL